MDEKNLFPEREDASTEQQNKTPAKQEPTLEQIDFYTLIMEQMGQ